MGIFFRKSVRVGPFRFNLSGSGIGVSCGIPGLRIGTGPRGNYISAGHGGIYYRAGLPTARPRSTPAVPSRSPDSSTQVLLDLTLGELKSVDSGVSMQMQDTSSQSFWTSSTTNESAVRWRLRRVRRTHHRDIVVSGELFTNRDRTDQRYF